MLSESELRKKIVFLTLHDVLVGGTVGKKPDNAKVREILVNLHALEKKGLIKLVLISGLTGKKALKVIKGNGLDAFFGEENIHYVTDEYINSKQEIDKKRHRAQLDNDPDFNDEYFKQHVINGFIEKGLPKGEMILIGRDLWVDAFYTRRFSGIDFALMKESLSERGKKAKGIVKGLTYIKMDWKDIQKLLAGKFKKPDYRHLETYIYGELKQHLFANLEGKIINAHINKRQKLNN